ncbi:MAG TPA: iron-sulfur cluster assembly scaffold protein [Verrucomicrobiales bacterium]|jgi:nitrogen fixation NifU-like protein|nr:iron-sulfur cluster assembly scaffold protein [Verrucomicrobiales bacterium]
MIPHSPNSVDERIQAAIANPQNMGEMADADATGTVGNPECGDMVRMWLKFTEKDGKKIIDRASFQSFGCQTAIAVASLATEMLKGKTVEEARELRSSDLSRPLGPLPPMKLHCGDMVEGALRDALKGDQSGATETTKSPAMTTGTTGNTLLGDMNAPSLKSGKLKVVKLD